MKKLILSALLLAFTSILVFGSSELAMAKDVYVDGYYRNDGTYVKPHYMSSPNNTRNDNFSTYGNVNPYTGERGTKHRDNYNRNNNRYNNYR